MTTKSHTGSKEVNAARKWGALVLAGLILAACSPDSTDSDPINGVAAGEAPDEQNFYSSDDVITLYVPGSVGGGSDTAARAKLPFLTKHVPGNPNFQVENTPDITQIAATNAFIRDKPNDGSYLVVQSTSAVFPALWGQHGVEYELSDFDPVVGMQMGGVVYARAGAVDNIEDLNDAENLIVGIGDILSADGVLLLAMEALAVDYMALPGYDGSGPIRIAMQQGEIDISEETAPSYLEHVVPLVESGEVVPLMSHGLLVDGELTRDPLFPDLPHVGEVYEILHGNPPSGPAWDAYIAMYPARFTINKQISFPLGVPEEARAALQAGFLAMETDPEFQNEREVAIGPYALYLGDDLVAAQELLHSVDQDSVDWMLNWMHEEFGLSVDG